MSNTPQLRFPEFSGEWEEKTFGDILSLNMVPVEKPDTEYERLGILCHNKGTFHEHITDPSYIALDTLYKVHKHNFIVNITFAWEHAIAITTEKDEDALVTFRFLMFTFNNGYYYQFFKYAFSKEKFRYDLSVASPGGAGRNRVLNQKQLNKIPLIVPSKTEQQKIADFLSNVDSIIATETKLLNALQKKKKALMQKLFTQQLRFKSNNGTDFPEWEEKKLGEICEITGGGTPDTTKAEYWNGNIQWFTPTEIGKTKYISESKRKITQLGFEKSSTRLLPAGTILFTSRATLGEMSITTVECTTNQGFQSLIPNKTFVNPDYLYYLQPILQKYCYSKSSGSTFLEISAKTLRECIIPFPCKEEQQKIADCLSSMDSLIQNQQKVVITWQQRKKALLQQMFI